MVGERTDRNPLGKRFLRELRSEIGKYLIIFLLLAATFGFVSGFLVADGSMMKAYREGFEKYSIEDGNFRLENQANPAQRKAIQELGVTLYDNFYKEEELANGSTLRIFSNRKQVNLVCPMAGQMPVKKGEIALDRMYAENNQIQIGDTIASRDHSWLVTGYVALPDYSCLFSDNNDTMFDAVKFGVAVVTGEAFEGLGKEELVYSYSWIYKEKPLNEAGENDRAEELMKGILAEAPLEDFVPCFRNQAIQFTGEDMGSDRTMMIVLLYLVIVIMAFVFSITVNSTISREANVIGTLRASGYTRRELICHYMSVPLFVTLAGALVGNLLGYTLLKDVCAGMYYGSYSLAAYETIWNGEAFFLTTVIPVLMMVIIHVCFLYRKLTLSPLKFLRRDLSRKRHQRAFPLIFGRFRLRVIFQNLGNYGILFMGILFANLLLMFGMMFPSVLSHYQAEMEQNLLCNYQYFLKIPFSAQDEEHKLGSLLSMLYVQYSVQTENEDAEAFSAYSLATLGDTCKSEEVLLYGIHEDSHYIPIDPGKEGVFISSAYGDKYGIKPGDRIMLKEEYKDTEYSFRVNGIYPYEGAIAIFMDRELLNTTFDLGSNYFSGYFSDSEITDIDSEYIASIVDLEALTKVSRQLSVSMGGMMTLVDGFAMLIFMALVYLLSKIIIEKNAHSISMVKILGYTNMEISRLYIVSTSVMVVIFLLGSLPINYTIMEFLFRSIMMSSITGWIPFYMDSGIYVKMFLMGLGVYGIVAGLEYRKICRVPMNEALKAVE